MIQTIADAMRQAEERPVHWPELEDAPDRCPPTDHEPLELCACGCYPCECATDSATMADWYYDEARDDRNDGLDDDNLGLDPEDDYE